MFPFASSLRQSAYPLLPVHQSPPQSSTQPAAAAAASSSVLLPPPSPNNGTDSTADTLLALTRQTAHLQRTLQAHLDAQSAGLLAGLGRPPPEPKSSPAAPLSPYRDSPKTRRAQLYKDDGAPRSRASSAYTPTSSPRSRSRHPSLPPSISIPNSPDRYHDSPTPRASSRRRSSDAQSSQPPSLLTTRGAIHATLLSLARTKALEASALNTTLESHSIFLSNLERLSEKKSGLEREIQAISSGVSSAAVETLAHEEASLESEILRLESRLAEQRARLAAVKEKRKHDGSRLDARLSSWRAALEGVEKAVKEEVLEGRGLDGRAGYLVASPSPAQDTGDPDGFMATTAREARAQSVWALPVQRRTLDLVREGVEGEAQALEAGRAAAEQEEEACILGAQTWVRVARAVAGVEKALAGEVRRLAERGSAPESRRGSTARSKSNDTITNKKGKAPLIEPASLAPESDRRGGSSSGSASASGNGSMASSYMTAMTGGSPLPPTSVPTSSTSTTPTPTLATSANDRKHKEPSPRSIPSESANARAEDTSMKISSTNSKPEASQTFAEEGMQKVLSRMDHALALLESELAAAESRGWRLLVCAIGAEAEALREGREMLEVAVGGGGGASTVLVPEKRRQQQRGGYGGKETTMGSSMPLAVREEGGRGRREKQEEEAQPLVSLEDPDQNEQQQPQQQQQWNQREERSSPSSRPPRSPSPSLSRSPPMLPLVKEESSDGPSLDLLVSPDEE